MKRMISLLVCVSVFSAAPLAAARGEKEPAPDGIAIDDASRLRKLIPDEQLVTQAAQQYDALKQQAAKKGVLAPDSHAQVKRLRAIAKRIIPHADRWNPGADQWQWEVNLIATEEVNAFCMPGGKIAFFGGILDRLKLTDDEVAIVMGHEMAHALREHARERLAKSALTNAGARLAGMGIAAIFGIDSQFTDAVAGGAAHFAALQFSRSDESESDAVGMDLAARAGFDPRAGITLWKKMGLLNKSAPPQWLSTHPSGGNRIAEMQKHLPAVMPIYARTRRSTVAALPPYRSNMPNIEVVR